MPELELLYSDEHVFALYKPAGIHTVRAGEHGGSSLADLLAERFPHLENVGRSGVDFGLVQRLDLETSGVVLGAYSADVWTKLHTAIEAGTVQKTYAAVVEGNVTDPSHVSSFIGSPYRRGSKVRVYDREPRKPHRALPGSTTFVPRAFDANLNRSLISAVASPARRHQIRAHAAHLGHPLVGDLLYGAASALNLGTRKFLLHAEEVSLAHPVDGKGLKITSPLERELQWPR